MKKSPIYLIVIFMLISCLFVGCTAEKTKLTVLLEVDLSKISSNDRSTVINHTIDIISKRLDMYGVPRPTIQQQGGNRLLVGLPGNINIEAIKALLNTIGFLEFREVEKKVNGQIVYLGDYLALGVSDFFDKKETENRIFLGDQDQTGTSRPVAFLTKGQSGIHFVDANGNPISTSNLTKYSQSPSWIPARGDDSTPLTGALLSDAQPILSQAAAGSQPGVSIKWNAKGSIVFDQIAKHLYNNNPSGIYSLEHVLGIFLDNNLISAPQILSQSFGGSAVINGNFTTASASELAYLLKSSALPVPVSIVELSKIGQ